MGEIKGIYKHGDKWRVRKYEKHIGIYDTYMEAVMAVQEATEQHMKDSYFKQYMTARKWLIDNGHIRYNAI